ncbi:uncharacterized protein METZ01_LOCUS275989, partial [marine metagenome]
VKLPDEQPRGGLRAAPFFWFFQTSFHWQQVKQPLYALDSTVVLGDGGLETNC